MVQLGLKNSSSYVYGKTEDLESLEARTSSMFIDNMIQSILLT